MRQHVVAYINADRFTSIGVILIDDSLHKSFTVDFNGEEDDVPYENVKGLAFHLDDLPELILGFEKEIHVYGKLCYEKYDQIKSQSIDRI